MSKSITKERVTIKIDKENQKSFGFVNNTFINIYTKDNPILNVDDECYFLFAHPIDFHRTLIGKGKVTHQIFIDGMNTLYYISLEEILENPTTINKFVYGKKFNLWKFDEGKLFTSRLLLITEQTTAEFLKTNASVKVQVEGHCDERGSVQFNLALGEKRAKSVRDYLVAQGVASGRVTIISLGKEKPVSFGHDEESWSKNRRGNFVVTGK